MVIKNTSKNLNPEWLFGGNPGAIERQEKTGQKELCNSSQLPRRDDFNNVVKDKYAEIGIKVLRESENDDLFYDVILPEGWSIKPTEHSMWSDLLNDKNELMAYIFYKAAFYDRKAFIQFKK